MQNKKFQHFEYPKVSSKFLVTFNCFKNGPNKTSQDIGNGFE